MGRIKNADNYEDRLIDLDIILYENLCIHITRLLGMLLAALSVQFVIDGIIGTGLVSVG